MKKNFLEREIHYNLRVANNIYARKPRTTAFRLEKIRFLWQNLWRGFPSHITKFQSITHFKRILLPYATVYYARVLLQMFGFI